MIEFRLNGEQVRAEAPPDSPLLFVLMNDLAALGPKYGCGRAQCGACTVLIDGAAVRSCVTLASAAIGHEVTTLAGLREGDKPGKLQAAFIHEQAAQCGYCGSGMIMQAQSLLNHNPQPTAADVREALNGNLCRCGVHNRIIRAVLRAASEG